MEKLVSDAQTKSYFNVLENGLNKEIAIANKARKNGKDPKPYSEIPIAKDLADRVENIIGVKVAEKIRSFEGKISREEASLIVGRDIAQDLSSTDGNAKAIEKGVRVAVAMLTEGVVAAPIEGIDRVDIAKNDDGTEYLRMFYAGPIRSAGGTAQALSILICDFIRRAFGIDKYKPRKDEVNRYVEEIGIYQRVANLQYMPSEDEIKLIVENCPICIDGEPTEEAEVEGYRNLKRVDTNRVRGGMALVIAEGLALKAPKVQKHVKKLQIDGWGWLDQFLSHSKKDDDKDESKEDEKTFQVEPNEKYLRDLLAGRPVFAHPSRPGGFRLRYGRSRNTSLASSGMNPAGMIIMDDFISPGTQFKMERPGKAAGIVPVDSIEGPTVRLKSKSVVRIDNIDDAYQLKDKVEHIIDVGEILINYGDFLENNHPLVTASYCFEWWIQDFLKSFENCLSKYNEKELKNISQELALELSNKYNIPLHPKFTYLWHDITKNELKQLSEFVKEEGTIESNNTLLKLPYKENIKLILEKLLILHTVRDNIILIESPLLFIKCIGLDFNLRHSKNNIKNLCDNSDIDIMQMINQLSGIIIKKRAPIRIGTRMGRPGKSDKRKMNPSTHVLFPIAYAGGIERKIKNAVDFKSSVNSKIGRIRIEIGIRTCSSCNKDTYESRCDCGEWTEPKLFCPKCDAKKIDNNGICPKCNIKTISIRKQDIDFRSICNDAMERMCERDLPNFKGVKKLSSKHCTPEPFEKGIFRAKYDLYTFKDGTIRYDMSDVPLTHIRPNEIGVSVKKIKKLGYLEDIHGNPITDGNQVLCLKVQDIIISEDAAKYLLKISKFIDDLLVKYYKIEPYYNAKKIDDMVGALIMGLAPHTSAGILGRVIGYIKSSVCYAHPFFHAAKRRNCDGDEDSIILLLDGLLNFSFDYLPDKRGGKMDAPLVLTSHIEPSEVDGEAHNVDVCEQYPLEFYEATEKFTNPKDLETKIDLIGNRLGTPLQYTKFMFTHDTTDIASGPIDSSYKTIEGMENKMNAQLSLGKKIRAVDETDVAERVLTSHFLPDMIGNLRAFSRQGTRCIKCGKKYRRPPLKGNCVRCGGNVILTVHEGSVKKYLKVSMKVANEYDVTDYTKQRIELLGYEIKTLFESDKSKQMGLEDFM